MLHISVTLLTYQGISVTQGGWLVRLLTPSLIKGQICSCISPNVYAVSVGAVEESRLEFICPSPLSLFTSVNFAPRGVVNCAAKKRKGGVCVLCLCQTPNVIVQVVGGFGSWRLYLPICLHPRPFPREEGQQSSVPPASDAASADQEPSPPGSERRRERNAVGG